MKKLICMVITMAVVVSLTACGINDTRKDTQNSDNRMTLIYNNGFVVIYVDNETGVQYILGSNRGVCVMVDENGKPLIYNPTEKGGAE